MLMGKVGMALVSPVEYRKVQGGPLEAAWAALVKLWTLTSSMIEALGQMVSGLVSGGKGSTFPSCRWITRPAWRVSCHCYGSRLCSAGLEPAFSFYNYDQHGFGYS